MTQMNLKYVLAKTQQSNIKESIMSKCCRELRFKEHLIQLTPQILQSELDKIEKQNTILNHHDELNLQKLDGDSFSIKFIEVLATIKPKIDSIVLINSRLNVDFFEALGKTKWLLVFICLRDCLAFSDFEKCFKTLNLKNLRHIQLVNIKAKNINFKKLMKLSLPELCGLTLQNVSITTDCLKIMKKLPNPYKQIEFLFQAKFHWVHFFQQAMTMLSGLMFTRLTFKQYSGLSYIPHVAKMHLDPQQQNQLNMNFLSTGYLPPEDQYEIRFENNISMTDNKWSIKSFKVLTNLIQLIYPHP